MTEADVLNTAIKAVEIYAARHPRPPHVTITQAAEMLGRSRNTIATMLTRYRISLNACGQIPIESVDRLLVSIDLDRS
ncbi:DNA-binding protein [Burkholderia cenocepacia]|uniref:DNA-binding protein n=1 Tax=Burkholderia cenocepacia TaxID=95486 RepID=UPI0028769DE9|nr:DNA-binding protein [Burkholderia cenocepacia]MDS0850507.1 DNA-binding protein [Burkholderia cenocepacia]